MNFSPNEQSASQHQDGWQGIIEKFDIYLGKGREAYSRHESENPKTRKGGSLWKVIKSYREKSGSPPARNT